VGVIIIFFLNGQNDTFSGGQNDTNSSVLLDEYHSSSIVQLKENGTVVDFHSVSPMKYGLSLFKSQITSTAL
jgi:hypothetical protein